MLSDFFSCFFCYLTQISFKFGTWSSIKLINKLHSVFEEDKAKIFSQQCLLNSQNKRNSRFFVLVNNALSARQQGKSELNF